MEFTDFQLKAAGVLMQETYNPQRAEQLDVQDSGNDSSDIFISDNFIDETGKLTTCQGLSLRQSVELALNHHLRGGPHWKKVESDIGAETPRLLLHGWTQPWDPNTDEVWTAPASMSAWASLYSWSGQLTTWHGDGTINLDNCPEILGYVYLLEISNQEFYAHGSRIARFEYEGSPNAPDHTAETDGKILARCGYKDSSQMMEVFLNGVPEGTPDAYIFKGKVIQDASFKVLHTYRIIRPTVTEEQKVVFTQRAAELAKQAEEDAKRAEEEDNRLKLEASQRTCGCQNARNPYHTCVEACGCACIPAN